ncbi:hypothetical protein PA39016_002790027 [Pseudomonas aeruginosa 39016]|nr:hypothetical protein CSC30_6478 [Pseudomonas aeruginosa]AZP60204.1 Uncharacterized protein PA1840_3011 [Pseudomonas aeruginosa]EFQ41792.1 hypothetical protein PA39016_002790027 [Pseudomonas aeruginosa 39016]
MIAFYRQTTLKVVSQVLDKFPFYLWRYGTFIPFDINNRKPSCETIIRFS